MCTNPLTIYQNGEEYKVPCGKCISCRRKRASDWTIKLINEGKYYNKKCFITLTFDNKKLADANSEMQKYIKKGEPPSASFLWNINNSKIYVTKFIKRLRKHYKNVRIKYFKIGEYGDLHQRPHYHFILFGINFDEDRVKCEVSKSGKEQFLSPTLDKLWSAGRCRIQDCNSHNIAYISQYSVKKIKNMTEEIYKKNYIPEIINEETGHIKWKYKYKPSMSYSNRSKMSSKWIRKRPEQIEKGYLTDNDGHKYPIPRSYKEALKKSDYYIHNMYYMKLEELNQNYILEQDVKFNRMIEKNKEKILESQQKKNPRADF